MCFNFICNNNNNNKSSNNNNNNYNNNNTNNNNNSNNFNYISFHRPYFIFCDYSVCTSLP